MPLGTNSQTLSLVPGQDYVVDPPSFNAQTRKNVLSALTLTHPTGGGQLNAALPQVGIVSQLRLMFIGSIHVTGGTVVFKKNPYDLLGSFVLAANGQNNLFSCTGADLKVLEQTNTPAMTLDLDLIPTALTVGDHDITLTYEVPIAVDQTNLTGALFAQSSATNLALKMAISTDTEMFDIPANVTVTGTWTVQTTLYEIPFDAQGRLIIPDLSRLHGYNAVDVPFSSTGDVRAPLIRSSGQLLRLFSQTTNAGTPLSPTNFFGPADITRFRLNYGGNQQPMDYSPADLLRYQNRTDYGALPIGSASMNIMIEQGWLILDLVRENPARDVLYLQGVTELAAVTTVAAGVTVTAGNVHLVQETLF